MALLRGGMQGGVPVGGADGHVRPSNQQRGRHLTYTQESKTCLASTRFRLVQRAAPHASCV
eukprot:6517616-Pyramimonas_sp.AAC.1